jgi:hypothetical protein
LFKEKEVIKRTVLSNYFISTFLCLKEKWSKRSKKAYVRTIPLFILRESLLSFNSRFVRRAYFALPACSDFNFGHFQLPEQFSLANSQKLLGTTLKGTYFKVLTENAR